MKIGIIGGSGLDDPNLSPLRPFCLFLSYSRKLNSA